MEKKKKTWFVRDYDRYFEGYVPQEMPRPRGGTRTVMVYVGDYYRFTLEGKALTRARLTVLGLYVLFAAVYACMALLPTVGNFTFWVGMPTVCLLLPMVYMVSGLYSLLSAPAQFVPRVKYYGLMRLARSRLAALVLLGAVLAGQVGVMIYCLSRGAVLSWGWEVLHVLCALGCAALVLAARQVLKRFEIVKVEKKKR